MIDGFPVAIIAARAHGGVIGIADRLPWRIPTDLAHFRARTVGKPVILGRTTFASIGRVLPGRTMIVLSRSARTGSDDVIYARSSHDALAAAVQSALRTGADEIMVAGGEQIFEALLPSADRLYLTDVDLHVAGDAYFPVLDGSAWREVARVTPKRGPEDEAAIGFVDLRRVRPDTPL